jgi:hemerythrin-like metal-binding protein
MPQHAVWEADYLIGHAAIDSQHQGLLAQCNALAECVRPDDGAAGPACEAAERRFDQALDRLKALAHEHFDTEAALLAGCDQPGLEDLRIESDEFATLIDEIATTENFSRLELQRFLTLWWVGHVAGSAPRLRKVLTGAS